MSGTLSLVIPQQQVRSVLRGQTRVLFLNMAAAVDEGIFSAGFVSLRGAGDPAGQEPVRLRCSGVLRARTRRRGPVVAVFLGARL